MSEVLSQQEIDRLLTGINSGEIEEENISEVLESKEIIEYDFRRPTRVSKDQLKTIRNLHESFSELFGFYLASRLQTMTTIDLIAVDQLRYSEYVLSISNPCVVHIFNIEETGGKALIEMTPDLVFTTVERLLGGGGGHPTTTRGITTIEQRIMMPLIKQALKILTTAWHPIHELTFTLSGFESNSDFVQIAPASEIVIVLSFEIKLGEETFLMNLCYPSFALEDVISRINTQYLNTGHTDKPKDRSSHKLNQHLQKTQVEIRAELGKSQLTVKELLALEEGDVLFLDQEIDKEIPIYVQDRLKFYGRPGNIDGRIAVKLTSIAEEQSLIGESSNGK